MLNIFLTGEDMHTATAVAIFGEKGKDKKYRKIAKAINFALAYGGSAEEMCMDCDSLETITIPAGVSEIPADAFYGCYGLKSVSLPHETCFFCSVQCHILIPRKSCR